jgi:hypothetical protein
MVSTSFSGYSKKCGKKFPPGVVETKVQFAVFAGFFL